MNPYDQLPPEQRGMSGSTKVLLAFGIGCGVLVLLRCGVFGVTGYFGANYFRDAFSDDPVKARDITDSIVTIEIPESLEPQGSIDLRVPFQGDRIMTGALYGSKEGDNHLIIGEFNPEMVDSGDIETQFRESMRNSGKGEHEDLDIIESETYDAKINGEDAAFRVSKAEGRESKKAYWQVTGEFRGDAGPALLIVGLEADKYSKDDVINIIKSMEDAPGSDAPKQGEAPSEASPAEESPKEDVPAEAKAE
jgi:hypothetical protein